MLRQDQSIALHRRMAPSQRFVTDPAHMPAHHQAFRDPKIMQRAAGIDPAAAAQIDALFAQRRHTKWPLISLDERPFAYLIGPIFKSIPLHGEQRVALALRLTPSISLPLPWMYLMISHYPVLECLVAFAIVFLIGFLYAKSKGNSNAVSAQQGVARA